LLFFYGVYATLGERKLYIWLLIAWFTIVAIVAPQRLDAWRYSFIGLIPLCMVAAVGVARFVPVRLGPATVKRAKGRVDWKGRGRAILVVALIIAATAGSWGPREFVLTASPNYNPVAQNLVYSSMLWMRNNTPPNSLILSVTDQNFRYSTLIAERAGGYGSLLTPGDISTVTANATKIQVYVAVTRFSLTPGASPAVLEALLQNYGRDSRYQLVYQNADVDLYKLNR
jgi:hypothetical protein